MSFKEMQPKEQDMTFLQHKLCDRIPTGRDKKLIYSDNTMKTG